MLPASVESNVEQILNRNRSAPRDCSQASARNDWSTASRTGAVRDFSATTTASASGRVRSARGTPLTCTVRRPPFVSVLARSVAPVKSSAMQPRARGMVV